MAEAFPSRAVEVEFTAGVWTDVTEHVYSHSIRRGRQRELDQFQAGTLAVVLDNRDRRFDPEHAAGPHFGDILPMRRIRVRATYAGVTYDRFTGFIDAWDQEYDGPTVARAVVTATDGLKVLAAADLPVSVYAAEVAADSPVAWWRLDEPAGSTTAFDSSGNDHDAPTVGDPTFGAETFIVKDAGAAMLVTGGASDREGIEIPAAGDLPTSGSWSLEFWLKTTRVLAGGDVPMVYERRNTAGTGYLGVRLAQGIGAETLLLVFSDDAFGVTLTSDAAVNDGAAHHVVVTYDGTTLRLYVDGALNDSGADAIALASEVSVFGSDRIAAGDAIVTTYDEVATYSTTLSLARIAAHNAAGRTPWVGDTAGVRIGRVLDEVGWPAGDRDLDTGVSTLQSADLATTVLEHARKAADSDFGRLFMTAGGLVRFDDRHAILNLPESAAFGEEADEVGYSDLKFDFSDQNIRNPVTVSRSGGVAQTVEDATLTALPPTGFGRHSYTKDGLLHDSDTLSRDAAEFLVSEYKDPKLRVTGLTVHAHGDPVVAFPAVLGLELGDEVEVNRRPQGVGDPITQDSIVEGISETVTPKTWTVSLNVTPALAGTFGLWGPTATAAKWGDGGVTVTGARWTF